MKLLALVLACAALSACGKAVPPTEPAEQKLPYAMLPESITRSAPDEYGVVCYRNTGSSQNLSCVQVVSPKANTP